MKPIYELLDIFLYPQQCNPKQGYTLLSILTLMDLEEGRFV